MRATQDLNVVGLERLIAPRELKEKMPMTTAANETVVSAREQVIDILKGQDARLLVIVGPCSIHDPAAAVEYAGKLRELNRQLDQQLCILMRVYFEKPRTTVGWRGLINDPDMNGECDVEKGLHQARELLLRINEMGVPAATELLDPVIPQYIADLVSWAAIGARTTESQTHRDLVSGLSMPIGFKNSTDGNQQVAVDAMVASRAPHKFLGVDQDGVSSLVQTRGNPWSHVVMRGGRHGSNYDAASLAATAQQLSRAGLPPRILVDCSHANSGKLPECQPAAAESILAQYTGGNRDLIGIMLESNLKSGRQSLTEDPADLRYGISITDSCLGWDQTADLLVRMRDRLAESLKTAASQV